MHMNIQARAALRTLAMIAIALLGPIVVIMLFSLDAELLFDLFVLSIVVCMIWMIYNINLGQLETEEKIREIQERRETMLSNIVKNPE